MILFLLKETFKSVNRAKASFLLTILSLSISSLLILASVISIQLSSVLESKIKDNVKINIFLKEFVKDKEIKNYRTEIESKQFVKGVQFISKDDAADLFVQETGEDFRDILDYNPLPASFVVQIKDEYTNNDSLDLIIKNFAGFDWADEVVFKNSFIYRVLDYVDSSKVYLFILTIIIFLIALYLVFTTIRLIINSRMTEFETMKLVGARLATIKTPVLLNGILAGLISSVVCYVIYYFVFTEFINFQTITQLLEHYKLLYMAISLLSAPFLGLIVTIYSLRGVTLRI